MGNAKPNVPTIKKAAGVKIDERIEMYTIFEGEIKSYMIRTYSKRGRHFWEGIEEWVDLTHKEWLEAIDGERNSVTVEKTLLTAMVEYKLEKEKDWEYATLCAAEIYEKMPAEIKRNSKYGTTADPRHALGQVLFEIKREYCLKDRDEIKLLHSLIGKGCIVNLETKEMMMQEICKWQKVVKYLIESEYGDPESITNGALKWFRLIRSKVPEYKRNRLDKAFEESGLEAMVPDRENVEKFAEKLSDLAMSAENEAFERQKKKYEDDRKGDWKGKEIGRAHV